LSPTADVLRVQWFGGEPLAGWRALVNVSEGLRAWCAARGVAYQAGITTNGYLLTPDRQETLLRLGVNQFQVTLDGLCASHDRLRVKRGGEGTFTKIVANIRTLLARRDHFRLVIRNNVDRGQLPQLDDFVSFIGSLAMRDPRVYLHLHPVGRWGDRRTLPWTSWVLRSLYGKRCERA
jgi:uncharacterized protein